MTKKFGNFIPLEESIVKKILNNLFITALAEGEEPNADDSEGSQKNTTPPINFEDLIQKARREEKEKQYKTIEKLKAQVATLTKQHNDDLLKAGELDNQIAELNKKLTTVSNDDSDEVKTLKGEIAELTKEKETLEKQLNEFKEKTVDRSEVEKEIREQLEKEYLVKSHKTEILAKHKDELLLPELVYGDTVEELDKNLEIALNRSKEIFERVTGSNKPTKPHRTPKPSNPNTSGFNTGEYSFEYLATLDPHSAEYKEVRKKLGIK